jgi:hypothetical protein
MEALVGGELRKIRCAVSLLGSLANSLKVFSLTPFLQMSLLEEELAVTEGGERGIVGDGDKGAAILAGKA